MSPSSEPTSAQSSAAYNYALSITSQFFFCGVPFRLDTSPKCTLNCGYCFAMSRGGRRTSAKLVADPTVLINKLHRSLTCGKDNLDVNGEMVAHRVPIHFGGISDPFSNKITTKVSLEILSALLSLGYPTVISTKRPCELVKDETLKALQSPNVVVQVSLTTPNDKLARLVEPNAPPVQERMRSLAILSKANIHTIVRLQPLILPWMDDVTNQLVPLLGAVGCKHVIAEFLKLPVERHLSRIGSILTLIGWDAYKAYERHHATLVGREWILPSALKWDLLQPLRSAIRQNQMTFGAADYGLNHLGDSDCCCGIDKLKPFSSWFNGNFASVIRNSRSDHITFSDVAQHWLPEKSIARYINSHSRLEQGNTVREYLRHKWNRPGTANAPDSFLGVSWTGEHGPGGDCIYLMEKKR